MNHSIQLTATEGNWRLFMIRKADPAFAKFQQRVLLRDHYACQYCGFSAVKHQDVINIDGNYLNNKLSNLITACAFCSQCFFLEAIGDNGFGAGRLIYLPKMSQVQLNALCHVLFNAMVAGYGFYSEAKNTYRNFRLLNQDIEEHLGEGFSNPALYGQLLIESKSVGEAKFDPVLAKNLRLLPDLNYFAPQVYDWLTDAADSLVQLSP